MAGNSSGIQVRKIREVTQNVLPAGSMQIVPFETFKLSGELQREQPGNVTADRTVVDNPATDIKVAGTGKADFSYGDHDSFWEELLCGVVGTPFTVSASTISAAATGNKLVGPGGSWTGVADGDMVLVTGFASNPALFVARVNGAPTSTDLVLDTNWITLANEAAGPTVTVYHSGRFRTGTTILTSWYETWNTTSNVGDSSGGVGVGQIVLDVPQPNKCTISVTLTGISSIEIATRLANASLQPTGNPLINSNTNFGDKTSINSGMGFRYGNSGIAVPTNPTLMPTLRVKKFQLTVASPLLAEGGAGILGAVDLSSDKRFDAKLALQVFRNTAAAETIYTDGKDPASICQIGVGFRDGKGHRMYLWLPALQPTKPASTGLSQSGREMVDVEYMAKSDGAAVGTLQLTKFS